MFVNYCTNLNEVEAHKNSLNKLVLELNKRISTSLNVTVIQGIKIFKQNN
jgi:hypothetical protein